MQINNIKLRPKKQPNGMTFYNAVAPDGRILEQFYVKFAAEQWAKKTFDFCKRKVDIYSSC